LAADDDKFPRNHQQEITSVLALVTDNNTHYIANLLDPDNFTGTPLEGRSAFDQPYDVFVAKTLEYRKLYKRAPGVDHFPTMFEELDYDDHKDYERYTNIFNAMVAGVKGNSHNPGGFNTEYIKDYTSEFIHTRRYRYHLEKMVKYYQANNNKPGFIKEALAMYQEGVGLKLEEKDYGFALGEDRALGFLFRDTRSRSCLLGIRELDIKGVYPTKQELFVFLAPQNKGKSMFLIQCGKMAALQGWNVVHYTLENSDEMTAQRYYQSFFSGIKSSTEKSRYVILDRDERDENEIIISPAILKPKFTLDRPDQAAAYLRQMNEEFPMMGNIRIRRFASGRLSFGGLERDLDELKLVHGFEPELIIVDMPQLMKFGRKNSERYEALEDLVTNLRGLAVDRDAAMVVPQQGTRSSGTAGLVRGDHGAGTIGFLGVADNLVTYSQTQTEEENKLARLYTAKVRNDSARNTILISQNYDSSVFCISSAPLTKKLRDQVDAYVGGYKEGEEDEHEDNFREQRRAERSRERQRD
jgi:hypothetical protein